MFHTIVVGGTFDQFHIGHETIFHHAFQNAEMVYVGLTSDTYAHSLKNHEITPFTLRKKALSSFFDTNGYAQRYSFCEITDPYEPAASGSFDAIIATSDTAARVDELNVLRIKRGLIPLSVVLVDLVEADDGQPISSTRVRVGDVDRTGHLLMPERLRSELNKPLGLFVDDDVITHHASDTRILTVGDVTTKKVLDHGVTPSLAVIDLYAMRKPFLTYEQFGFPPNTRVLKIASGPGFISSDARQGIADWATDLKQVPDRGYVIIVKGEEDLLVLPVIESAPIGSIVYYGQPPLGGSKEGLIQVVVTEEKKKEVALLLQKFDLN